MLILKFVQQVLVAFALEADKCFCISTKIRCLACVPQSSNFIDVKDADLLSHLF
jgi:hypothetical protein